MVEQIKKRVASLIRVRPEFEERYIILHKHTFPGVLAQIHRANIRNYSIFLRDGMLFSYFEYIGDHYEKDMAGIGEDQTTREWWKLTDPMQEPLATRQQGEWWASMEEIYFVDSNTKPDADSERAAYVVEVAPENLPDYKNLFQSIGADVTEMLKTYTIHKIAVFYKDGRVYYYIEGSGPDFQARLNRFFIDPQIEEFKSRARPLERKGSTASGDAWLAEMREVFHTN
jgi:L-rhamnose mutarotase